MSPSGIAICAPRRVEVLAEEGEPAAVGGRRVEAIRERWLVEDRWWSERPVRRAYFDIVLAGGRNEIVFLELALGRWYRQRD